MDMTVVHIKIKKMPRKTKAPKWSNHHNEELNARFASGEVPYQNLSPEVIRAVIAQFYPDRTYESFSRIIRVKAKKYIMEQNLHNGRKNAAAFVEAEAQAEVRVDDTSSYEDIDDDDLSEGSLRDFIVVQDLIARSERMSLSSNPPPSPPRTRSSCYKAFSMICNMPYMLYTYDLNNQKYLTIDFFCPCAPKCYFSLEVGKDNQSISLKTRIPQVFFQVDRLRELHFDDPTFNMNSHEATSFRAITDGIIMQPDMAKGVFTQPQIVKLPFKVDESTCDWDVVYVGYDELEIETQLDEAYYCVVCVNVQSFEKRRTPMKGPNVKIINRKRAGRKGEDIGESTEELERLRFEAMREQMRLEILRDLTNDMGYFDESFAGDFDADIHDENGED